MKWEFSHKVAPQKLPAKILIGFRTNLGPEKCLRMFWLNKSNFKAYCVCDNLHIRTNFSNGTFFIYDLVISKPYFIIQNRKSYNMIDERLTFRMMIRYSKSLEKVNTRSISKRELYQLYSLSWNIIFHYLSKQFL